MITEVNVMYVAFDFLLTKILKNDLRIGTGSLKWRLVEIDIVNCHLIF